MNQFGLYLYKYWKSHKETPCKAILNKQKYLFSKIVNRTVKQVLCRGWYQWEGKDVRKGCRRLNMVEILCTHIWKRKNKTFESIPGMGEGRESRIQLWYIVKTFVNVTMYPQYNKNITKRKTKTKNTKRHQVCTCGYLKN
jgi:hypothetical protein